MPVSERPITSKQLHEKDLGVPCVECHAEVGEECRELRAGLVHFCRRLRWLIEENRPDLLEKPS